MLDDVIQLSKGLCSNERTCSHTISVAGPHRSVRKRDLSLSCNPLENNSSVHLIFHLVGKRGQAGTFFLGERKHYLFINSFVDNSVQVRA